MCLDELGIRLVPLQCKFTPETGGFVPSWQDADALVTGKTKAIVLVTPNNRKLPSKDCHRRCSP